MQSYLQRRFYLEISSFICFLQPQWNVKLQGHSYKIKTVNCNWQHYMFFATSLKINISRTNKIAFFPRFPNQRFFFSSSHYIFIIIHLLWRDFFAFIFNFVSLLLLFRSAFINEKRRKPPQIRALIEKKHIMQKMSTERKNHFVCWFLFVISKEECAESYEIFLKII